MESSEEAIEKQRKKLQRRSEINRNNYLAPKNSRRVFLNATEGEAYAQNDLGCMYREGGKIEQDYEKAFHFFTLSANQDFALGQFNLALCYENGQGVKQSHNDALLWYLKSANNGYPVSQIRVAHFYERGQGVELSHFLLFTCCSTRSS